MTLFLHLLLPIAFALSPQTVRDNNTAIENLQKKNYYQAYQGFLKTLTKEPFLGPVHLNLGLTFQSNEESDKALQEYSLIERLPQPDPQIAFYSHFNAATVYAAKGEIPEALGQYQAALDLKPDSIEAKTNIELLWQSGKGKGKGSGKNKDKDKGDSKDQNQDEQSKNDKKQDQKEKDKEQPENKKQAQKFESPQLSQEDVRKILEELKNQEQQIRAEINRKESKESPREKNW